MKFYYFDFNQLLIAVLLGITVTPVLAVDHNKGDLVVHLTGFASDSGKVMIALVNSQEQYEARKGGVKSYQGVSLTIERGYAHYRFTGIPHGSYAVKVFHDENSNNDLDLYFFGMPKERYGFSNNAINTFGLPTYDKAKFIFDADNLEIAIQLK